MDIQQFLDSGILEKYVLGLASPEEMDHVEQMTRDYPEVNAHICKMQNCMTEYTEMNCTRPPKHLKGNSLSTPEASTAPLISPPEVYHLPQAWKWGAGIAAVMIFTFGSLSWIFYINQTAALSEIADLSTQIKQLRAEQNQSLTSNNQIQERYTILKDASTRQIHLMGEESSPQTHAVVYVNSEQGKCFLNIVRMPKCSYGHEYQMWAKVNGKHINLGILKVDEEAKDLYNIPYIKDCKAFVITLEKAGGSPVPTVENRYAYGGM
ncbi:MAG: anti-sigma-K factor RskA [Saprospiraceae bacterium]|jgi:anti-sigma-K factor RskA